MLGAASTSLRNCMRAKSKTSRSGPNYSETSIGVVDAGWERREGCAYMSMRVSETWSVARVRFVRTEVLPSFEFLAS